MAVKVITDSTSDIDPELAQQLDITVVPVYVRFGDKTYRDGVDITRQEFYERLTTTPVHPATSQPPPEDFAQVYSQYCNSVEGIVSVHISSKISGTFNSATLAARAMEPPCPIEVVDSKFNSVGLALVVMAAARSAQAGNDFKEVVSAAKKAIGQVSMFGMFGTMKYLARSGRISRAIAMAADILDVKPLLTFKDGQIVRAGLVRTTSKGMNRLVQFVAGKAGRNNIQELFIVHSQVPEQAAELRQRLGDFFPEDKILTAQLGASLGVHGGPGVLVLALRQGVNN
jgi:DegV family protein with EDD domain